MNLNIFWSIYILTFSLAMLIIWYFTYFKKRNKEKRCLEKTTGIVIRYSNTRYNGIRLPVVQYIVDNKKYKVVGPKFRWIVVKKINNPLNNSKNEIISNLTTKKSLPEILKISLYNNQIINFKRLSIYELYPVNSEVEVYYNPSKPKESYVERNIKPSKLLNLILLGGIILMIFSLYLISKI